LPVAGCWKTNGNQHPLLFLFALLLCAAQSLFGQSLFQNDGVTARTVGLGGPHLLGPSDATATLWNPASLAGLREGEFILTSNRLFEFSVVGVAGFWPSAGSVGVTLARFPMRSSKLERLSAAWAYSPTQAFSVGLSLHGSRFQFQKEEYTTSSISLVWHPLGGRLPLSRDPYHAYLFNVPQPPFPLALAVQASDLPLGRKGLDRYYVASAAAHIGAGGPGLFASFEWRQQENSTRLGFTSPVIHHLAFYAGISDFTAKNTAFGLAALGDGYSFDVVYSFAQEKILTVFAFRLGPKPGERARRHLSRGMALARSTNFRQALNQFKNYFTYESENLNARNVANFLADQVRKEDEKIQKLLAEAMAFEKKFKYVDAAVKYLAVLEINREDATARYRLARLEPSLDYYIQQQYTNGRQLFEEGNYTQARKIFENISLVRSNYADVKDYLNRIEDLQRKAAEKAFLRGLGYYSQQSYLKAQEDFQLALSLSPNYEEAQSYLDKAQTALQQQQAQINRLLNEAGRLSQQQQFTRAYSTYREVLDLDPQNETARQQMSELQSRIDAFTSEKIQTATRAFDRGDYNQVKELCQQILVVAPRHEEASALLQRLDQMNNRRVDELVRRGTDYLEAKEWNRAVEEFDKALSLDPRNKIAQQKRQEAIAQSDIQQLFAQAQALYNRGQFSQAMALYRSILERDANYTAARNKIDECQRQINAQIDKFFNLGLKYYAAEDYENAIREWEQALLLNPNHKQSLEYKQQAQQRLDALRKLRE
jgi:tetratricopeptide (TPR) repeat protein